MTTCIDCGKPAQTGRSGSQNGAARCIICQTAYEMRGWRYPATTIGQRKLRDLKTKKAAR